MRHIAIIFLLLFSCSKTLNNDELSLNQAKWHLKKIVNYEFTLRIGCFCPDERIGPHVIKVSGGKIISVNNLPYDITKTGSLMTIDELFEYIKTSHDRNPYIENIEYDSSLGYPHHVYFDFVKEMVDEEIGFQITQFIEN